MHITREYRARASIERRALTAEETAKGYIGVLTGRIPYNADSFPMTKEGRARPFIEHIAPGAFDRSIAEDPAIMLNAGHTEDPLSSLARIHENLSLRSDAQALSYEALLPDTQAARDTLRLVDLRIITGTSFEFILPRSDAQRWESRDASTDLRTIVEARLLALNPVIWPAYRDTSLTAEVRRRMTEDELAEAIAAISARSVPPASSTTPPSAAPYTFTHWALGIRAGRPPA